MLSEHDVVALTQDLAAQGLRRGDVGAIVHRYQDGRTYEVEFVDERGKTKCVATVPEAMVLKLNFLSLSA